VGEAWSSLAPASLLAELQAIEAAFGRDRTQEVRRGARTLDLDILLCDTLVMDTPRLTIPHPLISERLFVLVPLLELDPDLRDPRTGEPLRAWRRSLEAAGSGGGVYLHHGGRYTDPSNT